MLSPTDREKVLQLAAKSLVEELRKEIDIIDLITLPLDAVGQMVGLGPTQVARVMETRMMGQRKKGVSLRVLIDYQAAQKTQMEGTK